MRPVNLIPPEDRRGDRAPLRAGSLSYVVVGGLAAALVAVVALVMTGNDITERKNELAALEAKEETLAAEAQALAPYAEFASLEESRESTVTSLAESRFDWERVLRELAIVSPSDIWLTELVGSAGAGRGPDSDGLAQQAAVPSLELKGCAGGHEAVAAFVAALEDIDGVTRVGLSNTVREDEQNADAGECVGRGLLASFRATAVFDNATTSAPESGVPPAPGAADDGGVAQVASEQSAEAGQ